MSMNRHGPEQIVKKLRDGEAMPSAGKDLTAILVALMVGEAAWAAGGTGTAG